MELDLREHLKLIGIYEALEMALHLPKKRVKIAIIDSGVDLNIGENIKCLSFVDNGNYLYDEKSKHGTYIKEVIAATYSDLEIVSLKVVGNDGKFSLPSLIKAIRYCIEEKIPLINYSNNIDTDYLELREVIQEYQGLIICSSGNQAKNIDEDLSYPASYQFDNIISVGSCDLYGNLSNFSNYGKENVDLLAPGENIKITNSGIGTKMISGTSIATALVTAVIGLIFSINPFLTFQEIKKIIISNIKILPNLNGKIKYNGMIWLPKNSNFIFDNYKIII